jgi:GH15 family glucan-1,4-alpha-glucosidase
MSTLDRFRITILSMGNNYIEDYALIGDCHGCALVSKQGSVDWLTLERFDNDPLLWKILDDEKGAYLKLEIKGQWQWSRRYLAGTNILLTEALNVEKVIRIYDFMPVGRHKGSNIHEYTDLTALHALVRIIEVEGSPVEINIYQDRSVWPASPQRLFTYIGHENLSESDQDNYKYKLTQDTPLYVVISKKPFVSIGSYQLRQLFAVTHSFWNEWIEYSKYKGQYEELIRRSALTLKLLMHSPTGAIMAAATTSLPESIGGERNWDYRYCWPRDATFTLYALAYLGYSGEADRFCEYFDSIIYRTPGPIGVLYGLDGASETPERIIKGVRGYMGSSPVRVGNDAYKQRQLDIFGEFADWAYLHKQLGGQLSEALLNKIEETAELVKEVWKEKDHGLWEVRGELEDFTYSKVMCWVALDRAESLLESPGKYQSAKRQIEIFLEENCIFEGRLKKSVQNPELDASLLLVKIVGYPIDENVYDNTVTAIMAELSDGTFIKRYNCDDGLTGQEGEFLACSFWGVNAYLFLGKEEEAKKMFEKITTCFNDVGLLSEEIDTSSLNFLGNFPQALSHLAFIETASYFELYAKGGREALQGCHGDRVRNLHTTLHGPRAVWDFIIKEKNFKKLFPSRSSILEWK